MSYFDKERQWIKDNNIKVGDSVLVLRAAKGYEGGWDRSWVTPQMDSYLHSIHKIALIHSDYGSDSGIVLEPMGGYQFTFPYFTLRKVEENEMAITINGTKVDPSTRAKHDEEDEEPREFAAEVKPAARTAAARSKTSAPVEAETAAPVRATRAQTAAKAPAKTSAKPTTGVETLVTNIEPGEAFYFTSKNPDRKVAERNSAYYVKMKSKLNKGVNLENWKVVDFTTDDVCVPVSGIEVKITK